MAFATADLLQTLQDLPEPGGYLLAYSGGLDSHVLLHALAGLRDRLDRPVRAIHLHHGIQAEADRWQAHCEATCAGLQVPLAVKELALQPAPGESLEAMAREARYRAIAGHLQAGEMLLTAQHQDDQAETLLLQLLRGAGVEGLAGMPLCRAWRGGWQARPLLSFTRQELLAYAQDQALRWVEDPSNQDQRFDRNYLRHSVMPVLRARWPSAGQTLARSASHLANAAGLVRQVAAADLRDCTAGHGCLSVAALLELPVTRRHAVLREWVRAHARPLPDQARLLEIERSVLHASLGSSPEVSWAEVRLRRYRDLLWLTPLHESPGRFAAIPWPDQDSLSLPAGGALRREAAAEGVPARYWKEGRVEVRWRSEGIRCQPSGRQGSRSFKKLCQELGIPPWQRDRVPLVYVDERLVAVADYCLCGEFETGGQDACYRLHWQN